MKLKTTLITLLIAFGYTLTSCNQDDLKSDSISGDYSSNSLLAKTDSSSDCIAPGWASFNGGTTGGGNASETIVTTYAQLKAAIENKSVKVVRVKGTIKITTRLSLKDQSGKTIYGESGAKLVSTDQTKDGSGIINIKNSSNLIIRNLIFEGPGAYDTDGWDNAILDNCTNVWVDHCEFKDGVDGNFDIKNKSNYITVSYTKFHYEKTPKAGGPGGTDDHRFSDLIGSSDSATGDQGKLKITFARCWWGEGCKERMPRVRFGQVHMVNNYYNSTVSNKCIAAGYKADIYVDGNVFENVKEPISLMNGYTAITVTNNNSFINVKGNTKGKNTSFLPPYSISTLAVSSVKSDVTKNAGATVGGNICKF
ncbi:pectate lyase [Chishuiella sp.]|uniref:pectate lyase family protein n=1 Tax=Chishuiella sp. TaxID=1969467 RepID=UPI0028A6FA22|nr:pectate lyase [Chishuiella sp.]